MTKDRKPWNIVDLGCGTARNTVHLLTVPDAEAVALDLSSKMLDIAKQKPATPVPGTRVSCEKYDMLADAAPPPPPAAAVDATAIISTLVMEHVTLPALFTAASTILKPGGVLFLTNMHSDMSKITQAGSLDPETGQRIRPTSYAHNVEDVVSEAERQGFEFVVPLEERCLAEDDAGRLSPRRAAKYVGLRVWLGGILRKRSRGAT